MSSNSKILFCLYCNEEYSTTYSHEVSVAHLKNIFEVEIENEEKTVKSFFFKNSNSEITDIEVYLNELKVEFDEKVEEIIQKHPTVLIKLNVYLLKSIPLEKAESGISLVTKYVLLNPDSDFSSLFHKFQTNLLELRKNDFPPAVEGESEILLGAELRFLEKKFASFCDSCNDFFLKSSWHNRTFMHIKNLFGSDEQVKELPSAAGNQLRTFFIKNLDSSVLDITQHLSDVKPTVIKLLENMLSQLGNIKATLELHAEYVLPKEGEFQGVSFKTKSLSFYGELDCARNFLLFQASIVKESADFYLRGSGWVLKQILGCILKVNKFRALGKGSSYIDLPFKTNYVVNVKNKDTRCFMYSVLGKFLPKTEKHSSRPSVYEKLQNKYDFSCIDFPVEVNDIAKFEKKNNCSISVFGLGDVQDGLGHRVRPKIFPMRVAKNQLADHTNLLLISDEMEEKFHYCWITDFEKLVRSQITRHHGQIYICQKCFTHKYSEEDLVEHKKLCYAVSKDCFLASFPKDLYLRFRDEHKTIAHNYVIYADFESYLEKIEQNFESNSFNYQHHRPLSYAYLVVSTDPEFATPTPVVYRGEEPHKHFIRTMLDLGSKISGKYNDTTSEITMSDEDRESFANTTHCAMCRVGFDEPGVVKVRHHSHQYVPPGETNYLEALCALCNIKVRHVNNVTIVFHNGSKYDFKYIVQGLEGLKNRVDIIPSSEENYINIKVYIGNRFYLNFIDSFRFLNTSIEKLAETLDDSSFHFTRKFCTTPAQFNIARRKAVFCYDYIDDPVKLDETEPPKREDFYNALTDSDISEVDYQNFLEAWREFGCKTLGQYLDVYIQIDVNLLADIFQDFRKFCLSVYELDCANFLTFPSFAFSAALKMSRAEIRLFSDTTMTFQILSNIRGGMCQVTRRHFSVNNPQCENYDPSQPCSYGLYLDANSLYAYAMCKPLPYDDYRWLSAEELSRVDVMQIADDAETGLILNVDTRYPIALQRLHRDMPFLCRSEIPPVDGENQPRLMGCFKDRKNYVIHYVALKQALRHGIELVKINSAFSFRQRPFLKEFIEKNIALRQQAKSKFHQSLLKLSSNACFGKLLESPLKRKNIKLATDTDQILKYVARLDFEDRTVFKDQLVAIHLRKTEIEFDRPILAGFAVLELAKVHMYAFYHDVLMRKFGPERCLKAYEDTDGLILKLITHDWVFDLREFADEWLDFSTLPRDHPCWSPVNCKRMGMFKDETSNATIGEFVGLSSKMYACRFLPLPDAAGSESEVGQVKLLCRAKGIDGRTMQRDINFDLYKNVLFGKTDHFVTQRRIQSRKMQLYSYQTRKIGLRNIDRKRYILENGIDTLPWGHVDIKQPIVWRDEEESGNDGLEQSGTNILMKDSLSVKKESSSEHGIRYCCCADENPVIQSRELDALRKIPKPREFLHASWLQKDIKYHLDSLEEAKGKYGRYIAALIRIQGEQFKIHLPKDFARALSRENICEINSGAYFLNYLGRFGRNSHRYRLSERLRVVDDVGNTETSMVQISEKQGNKRGRNDDGRDNREEKRFRDFCANENPGPRT
ncbi:uncharacterized protein [Bemisia tabaci]|uniref:uncharacterized protein n=1 Tax=Bemisia tabaci TaxID=7038 RepID=UPI003B282EC0